MDTRFLNGTSKGNLYVIVNMTGNLTIFLMATPWARPEALELFCEQLGVIKGCHMDKSFKFNTSVERHAIANLLGI